MPELKGIDVSIFGISPGTMNVSDIHLQEMCGFWDAFVRAAGGTLRNCSASTVQAA
jgi:hypothetical protein